MKKTVENIQTGVASVETEIERKERLGQPLTMSVPDAGWKYLGAGRNASYEAVKSGLLPTIRVGKKKRRVVIAVMERKMDEAG